jgi:hypothetical protein
MRSDLSAIVRMTIESFPGQAVKQLLGLRECRPTWHHSVSRGYIRVAIAVDTTNSAVGTP